MTYLVSCTLIFQVKYSICRYEVINYIDFEVRDCRSIPIDLYFSPQDRYVFSSQKRLMSYSNLMVVVIIDVSQHLKNQGSISTPLGKFEERFWKG